MSSYRDFKSYILNKKQIEKLHELNDKFEDNLSFKPKKYWIATIFRNIGFFTLGTITPSFFVNKNLFILLIGLIMSIFSIIFSFYLNKKEEYKSPVQELQEWCEDIKNNSETVAQRIEIIENHSYFLDLKQ